MSRTFIPACALAAAALFSLSAVGQPHGFEGLWGRAGSQCASVGDMIPIEITTSEMLFYESQCGLADVKPVGEAGTTWQVEAECAGEGEQWIDTYILALISDGQPQSLVMIDMTYGDARLFDRCG